MTTITKTADAAGNLLTYMVAAAITGVVPAIAFLVLVNWSWDLEAQPAWSWLTIAAVPLATSVLVLGSRDDRRLDRGAAVLIVLHAGFHAAMLFYWDLWPSVAAMALTLDALLFLALLGPITGPLPGFLSTAEVYWTAGLFGILFPLLLSYGLLVTWRAEAVAGGRPYCIQIASFEEVDTYEPTRSLFDLSALRMQSRLRENGRNVVQHHALLVVEGSTREFYNWSYALHRFVAEVRGAQASADPKAERPVLRLYCRPEPHYAKHLPVMPSDLPDVAVSLGGRRFVVPGAYRPRSRSWEMRINATGPDFRPYNPIFDHRVGVHNSRIVIRQAAHLGRPTDPPRTMKARDMEPEFGLDRQVIDGPYGGHYTHYQTVDADGFVRRSAACSAAISGRPAFCNYVFVGDQLEVRLMISDVAHWREIEDRLMTLLGSFEAAAARASSSP